MTFKSLFAIFCLTYLLPVGAVSQCYDTPAQPQPCRNTSSGLVAKWEFDNQAGSYHMRDDTGCHRYMLLQRGHPQHPYVKETPNGHQGSGIVFSSRNQAMVEGLPSYRTVAFWMYRNDVNDGVDEMINFKGGAVSILRGSSRKFRISFNGGSLTASTPTMIQVWQHVAIVFDTTELKLYLDGALVGTKAFDAPLPTPDGSLVFGRNGQSHHYLQATLDDVRVYSSALPESSIQNLIMRNPIPEDSSAPEHIQLSLPQTLWLPQKQASLSVASVAWPFNSTASNLTYNWELVAMPQGSRVCLSGKTSPNIQADFTSGTSGDYVFECSVTVEGTTEVRRATSTVVLFPQPTQGVRPAADSPAPAPPSQAGQPIQPQAFWSFNNDSYLDEMTQRMAVRSSGGVNNALPQWKAGIGRDGSGGVEFIRVQRFQQLLFGADLATEQFTVAFWFKPMDGTKHYLFNKGSIRIAIGTTPDLGGVRFSTNYFAGRWLHVALAVNNEFQAVYINGRQTSHSPVGQRSLEDLAAQAAFGLGGNAHPSYNFEGSLDSIAFWSEMLNANEVMQLYELKDVRDLKVRLEGRPETPELYASNLQADKFPAVKLDFVTDGYSTNNVGEAPPPYVHPRIFFSPDQLPAIRARLATTTAGQVSMGKTRVVARDSLHSVYAHGTPINISEVDYVWASRLSYEAFRCLVDADTRAATVLAAFVAQEAEKLIPELERQKGTKDWQGYFHAEVWRVGMAFVYDFIYPWMTEAQRALVRKVLSIATKDLWAIGMDTIAAPPASTSNWLPWVTGDFVINLLAIEEEEGFDRRAYKESVKAYERFLTFGVFPESGAPWEGMGKNALAAENLLAIARRGPALVAAKASYNHMAKFILHTTLPSGNLQVEDDLWGGSYNRASSADAAVMKYAFPNDKTIDFVYRNVIGERAERFGTIIPSYGTVYAYSAPLMDAVFASDWTGAPTLDAHALDLTEPLTYLAKSRGLVVTRSAWTTDAAFLYVNARTAWGGHSSGNRGTFVFASNGVQWAYYPTGHNEASVYHSVVLVDGLERTQSVAPAKFMSFRDSPEATIVTLDVSESYQRNDNWKFKSFNAFRLENGSDPWMDVPIYDLPDWYRGDRPSKYYGQLLPVEDTFAFAFRSTMLVRGDNPYAVIVDDIHSDGSSHTYEWRMVTQANMKPLDLLSYSNVTDEQTDCLLEHDGQYLFVRLLSGSSVGVSVPTIATDKVKRLVYSIATTEAVSFRVLLYPLKSLSTAIPETGVTTDLMLRVGDDTVSLHLHDSGQTEMMEFTRAGSPVKFFENTVATPNTDASSSDTDGSVLIIAVCAGIVLVAIAALVAIRRRSGDRQSKVLPKALPGATAFENPTYDAAFEAAEEDGYLDLNVTTT